MRVYGTKEAIERLKPKLAEAIEHWLESVSESDEWGSLDIFVGEDLSSHMSDAAMAVLRGIIDAQREKEA